MYLCVPACVSLCVLVCVQACVYSCVCVGECAPVCVFAHGCRQLQVCTPPHSLNLPSPFPVIGWQAQEGPHRAALPEGPLPHATPLHSVKHDTSLVHHANEKKYHTHTQSKSLFHFHKRPHKHWQQLTTRRQWHCVHKTQLSGQLLTAVFFSFFIACELHTTHTDEMSGKLILQY